MLSLFQQWKYENKIGVCMHMVTPCCKDLLPAHLKLSLDFFKLCGLAFIVPAYLWYESVLRLLLWL